MLVGGAAQAEPVVIAALGDSLTQGYGLAPEAGLVPQLEAWLIARGADVRMINAGVSGDTSAGGLARIGWTLTPEVDGLMVALGGNDMLRGLDPAELRANLDGILSAAKDAGVEVLLVGMSAPLNFGPDYKAAFDAAYPELAQAHGALLVPDMLGPIRASDRPATVLLQADMLHPSPAGVALIVDVLGPGLEQLLERLR